MKIIQRLSISISGLLLACLSICPLATHAQEPNDLENRLNSSGLCAALPELDAFDVAELVGLPIDFPRYIPVDPIARWDKDRHEVRHYQTDGERYTVVILIGCQPSDQSIAVKTLSISASDVRLSDSVKCEGALPSQSKLASADCEVSGAVGSFIAKLVDLEAYVAKSIEFQ